MRGLVSPYPLPTLRLVANTSQGSSHKDNSNKINAGGLLRGPTMCTGCLSSIMNWDEKLRTGRGSTFKNEYISYVSPPSHLLLTC
jgi:hypothetical protein